MVAAAILTSWLASPGFVFAAEYKDGSAANGGAKNIGVGETFSVEANSSFEHNTSTAQNYGGGAIYSNGGIVEIGKGSSFNENYLNQPVSESDDGNYRSAGGAISSWNGGEVKIGENVSFTNNGYNSNTGKAAWSTGGAIYVDTNTTDLSKLTIESGSSFKGNAAGSLGGAIYVGDSNTNITSTVFEGNKAGSWGGAIFAGQYFGITGNQVTVDGNSSFKNNEAGKYGGAIANQYTTLNIGSSTGTVSFDGNIAGIDGGAIHVTTDSDSNFKAKTSVINTVFTNNTAVTGSGGAIYNPAADMTLENVSFGELVLDSNNAIIGAINGNTAGQRGGAIYNYGGTVDIKNGSGSIIFAGNHADDQGGAISNNSLNDPASVAKFTIGDNAFFVNNTAGTEGGAISNANPFADGKTEMTIGNNALFQGNQAATQGGAIHNQRADITIGNDAKFYNNTAVGYGGGAIYQDNYSSNASNVIIGSNAEFIGNSSTTSHGGAIMNFNSFNNTIVKIGEGAKFIKNSAGNSGGAISNWGGTVTLAKNSKFTENHAATDGGAIYNAIYGGDGTTTINGGSEFIGNTADGKGGAIFNAGTIILDSSNGDMTFKNNKANNIANDIYMDTNSVMTINGTGSISFGGGVIGDASASISNNGTNLVLETGSKNAGYLGDYTQASDSVEVNSEFFGGTNNINGGTMSLNKGAEIVAGSSVILGDGTSIDINGSTEKEKVGDVYINGEISSLAQGDGSITLSGGNLIVNSDQSGFTGDFTQNGDINTSTTITADGTFFGGTNEINSGKLVVKKGASLKNDIEIKDYSVALDLDGRELLLSNGGIEITGNNQSAGTHSIKGSLNLENTDVKVDAATGIQSDVYIASGSTLTNTDGSKNIVVGNDSHNVTLSLGAGAVTDESQTLNVSDNSTINLTPNGEINGSLNLHAAITGGADANILVDGTELKAGDGKYSVGTVALNSDNSGFVGKYTQNDGTVIVNDGSIFFGGTNNVNTVVDSVTGETTSGALVLEDGALLSNNVDINGNATSEVLDLASVSFKGTTGEITQTDITSGEFNYAGTETAAGTGVNVNNAGAIFENDTIITELDAAQNALVLNTNTTDNKGVRFLGFGKGSGVEGDIRLGNGTGLAYLDGAYIKDNSSLVMDNADLIFANDKTDINYNPEISGSGTITKGGMGTTTIQSALNENIDIVNQSGALNLVNNSTAGLGNISVGDVGDPDPDKTPAVVNIAATNGTLNLKDINVFGENAVLNIMGNATGGNAVVNKGTLGVFGQSSINSLSLGSTLNMLGNNTINNLNIGGDFTLTDNSNYMFDVDPRSKATDTINATGSFNNTNASGGDPYTMLITGINFTQSPIDRNVDFDIRNLITADGRSQIEAVKLQDGGVVANSQMGKYLITSSGASNMLNANLIHLNPQMYRGQVATVASYANQLVVNNILFDHMNILANDLIARDKNANRYAAANPLFAPYQYSKKDGDLWFKGYGNFERISMTQGLNVGNNAYGSIIGADFPLITYKNGWNLVPTAYIAYNGGHQTFDGVSMYQNGAQVGAMATAYKDNWITSLLAYGGGYANDMSVKGGYGSGSDTTGNWFAGVASKTAYNYHLPHDLILQPTALVSYNIFGNQNYHSNFGNMSMNSGFLNGINVAPGVNLIWNKKTFSLYATAQLVFNIMGDVSGKAGNIDLNDVRMKTTYFEYGVGAMKRFKDRFTGYVQITLRNGYRTGIGFQGGLQWKIGK